MKRDFEDILESLKENIAGYDYYVDFAKVFDNVQEVNVELNILNSLISSKDIESDFKDLLDKYPECIKVIPILLAVRNKKSEILILDKGEEIVYTFKSKYDTIEKYATFMRESGLFDLISNRIINNLVDYVTGVEVGLDTNGRKNRGGHLMENAVEQHLKNLGNILYHKEFKKGEILKNYGIDLSEIANNAKTEKRFDFVIKTNEKLYVIETNFYKSNGSKLNETARSYKMLGQEMAGYENVDFIWITDGQGWKSAKNNLEEAYEQIEHMYTLLDLENGILSEIIK